MKITEQQKADFLEHIAHSLVSIATWSLITYIGIHTTASLLIDYAPRVCSLLRESELSTQVRALDSVPLK